MVIPAFSTIGFVRSLFAIGLSLAESATVFAFFKDSIRTLGQKAIRS
jgi:hypothetical protein